MDPNAIGDRGEMLASVRLTESNIFMTCLLGGKVPAYDILAEINPGPNEMPYQFLIQVKSTDRQNPYTVKGKRIKTPIPNKKLGALVDRPLPTYVAGVDLNTEDVFIVPAFDKNAGYSSSIPTSFKLSPGQKAVNKSLLLKLKEDVIRYWQGINIDAYKTTFKSSI